MMKYIVILAATLCLAYSQRPPYAGSSNRYPVVLPQFLDGQEAAGTIANRIDVENGSSVSLSTGSSTTSTIPPDLPVDALGDIELINRIKTWPKEKQPFWFINWQQIQAHRGDSKNRGQPAETQPNTKSFFAG